MRFYPFKFEKIFHEKIWGSENWAVSGHESDPSVVANGALAGQNLNEIVKLHPNEILGYKLSKERARFPLLIKILEARKKLSVQVHPDDRYARLHEHELGKTEVWYVIKAGPDAKIICGLEKTATKAMVRDAIKNHSLEPLLKSHTVNAGDIVFINPGTIHALEENLTVYEVQEASDVTYRLYDWGRTDEYGKSRELHIDKGLEVIGWGDHANHVTTPALLKKSGHLECNLVNCSYFALDRFILKKRIERNMSDSFEVITALGGNGVIFHDGERMSISENETILVPAAISKYAVEAASEHLELLITHKP